MGIIPTPILAKAMIHVAHRRGLAGFPVLKGLVGQLLDARVGSIPDLRRWLSSNRHSQPAVASRIMGFLPESGGEQIGGISLLFNLSVGAKANTWLVAVPTPGAAKQEEHHLLVIKRLEPGLAKDPTYRTRFQRETQLLSQIVHPHVVRSYGGGVDAEDAPFLVLEFIDGADLGEELRRQPSISPSAALATIRQVVAGMEAVHAAGVVHRDLCPANLLRERSGRVAVADFGLARLTDLPQAGGLTITGALLGDPAYCAPEQCAGSSNVDVRADIYAVGATWYHLVSGATPIGGSSPQELRRASIAGRIAPIDQRVPDLPAPTAALIMRCLATAPDRRPSSMSDLLAAIDQLDRSGAKETDVFRADGQTKDPTGLRTAVLRAGVSQPNPSAIRSALVIDPGEGQRIGEATQRAAPLPMTYFGGGKPLAGDIIHLRVPRGGAASPLLVLVARSRLVLGRLDIAPSDIVLRNYPKEQHRTDNARIGRTHIQVQYDAARRTVDLFDLRSTNGTILDERVLNPGQGWPLQEGLRHRVRLAGSVELEVQVLPQRTMQTRRIEGLGAGGSEALIGIDGSAAVDAVVLSRPSNRPSLAYVQVLRRVTLGGDGADVPLFPSLPSALEIVRFQDRWLWRVGDAAWRPISADEPIESGSLELLAGDGLPSVL